MFRLLAQEVPAARLHEVRRFAAAWEREASVQLRGGDVAAVAAYDRHGRIRGGDEEAAYDRAAAMWLADHLRGKDVLLLAGSNTEAAGLSRRVQAQLAQMRRRPAAGCAGGRQLCRHRRPGPRPPQHADRRRRPRADQPGHPPGHRVPRARRGGATAAPRRDLDRAVPRPPVLPRTQRRACLRRQRARRPGSHGRHRAPARHRVAVPAGSVRRHDPGPGSEHRARGHRPDCPARPPAVPAGHRRIRARRRPAASRPTTCPPPSRFARPRNGPEGPATYSPCGPPPSG